MTATRRPRSGLLGGWLGRHPYVLPFVTLSVGAAFRFFNLNWDNGHQLHPDERWIYMVVSGANGNVPLSWPSSWAQLFDVRDPVGGSPLNPHSFAYGSLPFYLLAFVAGLLSWVGQHIGFLTVLAQANTYGSLPLVGRPLSGILDLSSLIVLFLIGRRIYGYWTGVLAMALGACTVLNIQLSHFYTVDTVLLPLALATVLAAVDIVQHDRPRGYIWGGIAFGAALATKTTALLLFVPLGAAAVLAAWYSLPCQRTGGLRHDLFCHLRTVASRLNRNLQWLLGAYVTAGFTFVLFEPYAVLDRTQLIHDVTQQETYLVTNNPPFQVPFTIQYAHTIPYLYQLKNMIFWEMGLPLGLTAIVGTLFALYCTVRLSVRREEVILLAWVIPYFLFVGRFFAKFNRYMLPITPVMALLGAAFLIWLVQRRRRWWRASGWTAITVVAGISFLYSLAYMNIYEHPNTRVAASRWMYTHMPAGTQMAVESAWDDTLPLPEDGHSASIYPPPINPELYGPDDNTKIAKITQVLQHAQYIVLSSQRIDHSIPRLPTVYPITTRYYQLLFGKRLNFRLVKQFQQHPQLGPFIVHDYPADESFHVYDHPNVRIFKRISGISAVRVRTLLTAGLHVPGVTAAATSPQPAPQAPDRRLMLSKSEWAADQRSPTMDQMFPPGGFAMRHPILVWLFCLEIIGLIAFPFSYLLFSRLLDRGYVVGKTLGLLLAGYLVWIAVRLHAVTFDRGAILALLLLFIAASLALAAVLRSEIAAFVRQQWKHVLTAEIVFLAGFAVFIVLRMWYPDLGHQFSPVSPSNVGSGRMGEKQMELAFLNAIVRSRVFPPYDPFFAHGYINYYYYGFYLVGLLCKLTEIAPTTGFNLAIATFFAMLVGNIYAAVSSLTRRIGPGVLAAIFVGMLGNLNGGWQLIRGLMSVATVHSAVPLIGGLADVLSGLRQVIFAGQQLPPFDFWEPTRIIPPVGGVISEFPYFTYLFADLHPHLMAYPMTAAALALAASLVLGSHGTLWRTGVALALAALLVGAIAVTNPWDYPTYLIVIGLGAFVGAYAIHRTINLASLVRPALWLGGAAVLSFLLYLPFKQDYHTVFDSGIGLVRNISPAMLEQNNIPAGQVRDVLLTPLRIYLEHFGFFLFVIVTYLAVLLLTDAGGASRLQSFGTSLQFFWYHRDRAARVWRASRVARRLQTPAAPVLDPALVLGLVIVVLGLVILQDFLLAFLVGVLGLVALLLLRLSRHLPATQLFVLSLLVVPLLLSLGTQIVFIKDWLAGGPDFRMNTIFKFYNQSWVLFATTAAAGLYFFMSSAVQRPAKRIPRVESETRVADPAAPQATGTPAESAGVAPTYSEVAPLTQVNAERLGVATYAPPGHSNISGNGCGDDVDGAHPLLPPMGEISDGGDGEAAVLGRSASSPPIPGGPLARPLALFQRWPLWSLCFVVLLAGSLMYTYAGTISRETYRTAWLPEASVPWTLDGSAFMKVAYPGDYAAISWLNAHVRGAHVIAEAGNPDYDWRSRVSMFTGLPTIINGIHEPEQRYADEFGSRNDDLAALYNSTDTATAWRIIHRYGVRYIYVGFSERQQYARVGLAKFNDMVGHGLRVVYRARHTTIYEVTA